uniref:VWFA domain-containing protein n=1 Tax=Steinernema glaseri TaxID=37863 RepID=A0A1I7ZJV4_9BILA
MYSSICTQVVNDTTPVPATTTMPPPPVENARACSDDFSSLWLDIVFVLDSSMSVDSEGFNFERTMLYGLIRELDVAQKLGKYTRIAYVNVGSKAHRISNLKSYRSSREAADALLAIKYLGDPDLNVGA